MKRLLTLFKGTYLSNSDGSAKIYKHEEKLCDLLGQARSMKLQFIGNRSSGASCRAIVKVYEGSDPANRPSEIGSQTGVSVFIDDELRPDAIVIEGPFMGRVDVELTIVDSSSVPATQQQYDLAVHATLFMD